jgi:hypothetical protein
MSESAFEPVGDVGDTAPDADAPDEGAEDAEAQELLDGMQEGADEDDSPEKLREQVAHWKRMSRQHERTATKNSAAAAKLAEIENANKSDLEKANEALAAAQQERDSLVTERQRMLAAAAHDLPPDLIEYLGDGTAEEISERAEQLAGIINTTAKKLAAEMAPQPTNGARPTGGRRPVDALRPGAAPADNRVLTPDQAFRQLLTGDSD